MGENLKKMVTLAKCNSIHKTHRIEFLQRFIEGLSGRSNAL